MKGDVIYRKGNWNPAFGPSGKTRLAVGFTVLLLASSVSLQAASPPNIILIMPDDVGYGNYACLGNLIVRTPSVDAFKTQSVLFRQFHVSPTCSPTRASLMSGGHEFKNGVTHTILEGSE